MKNKIINKQNIILFQLILIVMIIAVIIILIANSKKEVARFDNFIKEENISINVFDGFEKEKKQADIIYTKEGTFGEYQGTIKIRKNEEDKEVSSNEFVTKLSGVNLEDEDFNKMISKFVTYCTDFVGFSEEKDGEIIFNYKINSDTKLNDDDSLKTKLLNGINAFYAFAADGMQYYIEIYYENGEIYGTFVNQGKVVNLAKKPSEFTEEDIEESYKEVSDAPDANGDFG